MTTGLPPLTGSQPELATCPHCRLRSEAAPQGCPRCGGATPTPGSAWREGAVLVARRDATLPDACVRCGKPGDGEPIRRSVHWHHPALYLLLLLGVVPYLVVWLAVRRRTTLTISVCAHHRQVRRRALWAGWGVAGAAIALFAAAAALDNGPLTALSFLMLVTAPLVSIPGRRLVSCTGIDGSLVRARGASAAFLDGLPDWSDPGAAPAAIPPPPATAPMAEPAWASADIGAILGRAWPELTADHGRSVEYERALEGLHPGVIETVTESFAREHKPLPSPAILRMAVQARAGAGVPARPTVTRPPAWAPPVVARLGARMHAGVVTAGIGLVAFVVPGSTERPWATVSGAGPAFALDGSEVGGSPLVVAGGFTALLTAIVLAVLVVRRSTLRRLRIGLGVSAGAMGAAVIGALLGLRDVLTAPQQIRDAATPESLGVGFVVPEVAVAGGLWLALASSSLGLVVSIYGYRAMRRSEEAA
jgi:hypothetical protein